MRRETVISINQHEELTALSSYTSKIIKKKFGKGPENCFTQISDQFIVIHLKKYITPIEEALISEGKIQVAESIRNTVMKDIYHSLNDMLMSTFGKRVEAFYTDWNYLNNTGVILGEWEEQTYSNAEPGLELKVESEFRLYGDQLVQQIKEVDLDQLSQNMYVVKCKADLMPIEKLLLKKGLVELMKEREKEIRQFYHSQTKSLTSIFKKEIEQLFLFWNYEKETYYLLLVLN
ncbi:Na-translocating system protein MpsC family protein [Bacillus sp. PS06]|uniref:Na-translocating system protein MpsC family protein n=1 Tax=Bacillus sp. PS06 TaxID=2764176 RepID=UPI0017859767|nr:Na-translocating system protein MpsC family protein [Bacillus sp. PS06]MBD8070857.1 DUF2294 family protein [Bacillus sp. PS06]